VTETVDEAAATDEAEGASAEETQELAPEGAEQAGPDEAEQAGPDEAEQAGPDEAEQAGPDEAEQAGPDEQSGDRSVSELVEQLGRDTSTLVFREVVVTASRHVPALRRAARDVSIVVVIAVAFATAFALVNWAVVDALSSVMPVWGAALVVAAFWAVVGMVLLVIVLVRLGNLSGLKWWRAAGSNGEEIRHELEQARDDAEAAVRETLERLSTAVAREAGPVIASAMVPVAGGLVDAGESILEAGDDIIDTIEEEVPGGGAVRQVIDLALIPGRFGLRIATTVIKGGSGNAKSPTA
jgi:hypothetical protein